MSEIILCKFRKTYGNHNAGEVAGFSQRAAEELFEASIVNFVKMDKQTREVSIVKECAGQIADDEAIRERQRRQEALKRKVDTQVAKQLARIEAQPEPKPIRMLSPEDDPTLSAKEAKAAEKKIAAKQKREEKKAGK